MGEWSDFDATIFFSLKFGNMSIQSRFANIVSNFSSMASDFPLLFDHVNLYPSMGRSWRPLSEIASRKTLNEVVWMVSIANFFICRLEIIKISKNAPRKKERMRKSMNKIPRDFSFFFLGKPVNCHICKPFL